MPGMVWCVQTVPVDVALISCWQKLWLSSVFLMHSLCMVRCVKSLKCTRGKISFVQSTKSMVFVQSSPICRGHCYACTYFCPRYILRLTGLDVDVVKDGCRQHRWPDDFAGGAGWFVFCSLMIGNWRTVPWPVTLWSSSRIMSSSFFAALFGRFFLHLTFLAGQYLNRNYKI